MLLLKNPHVCLQIAKFRRAQSQGSVKTGERSNNPGRRSSDKGGEPIAQAISKTKWSMVHSNNGYLQHKLSILNNQQPKEEQTSKQVETERGRKTQ